MKKIEKRWISDLVHLDRGEFCYTVLASTDKVFFAQDGKEEEVVILDRKNFENGKQGISASLVMFDGEIYKSCSFSHDFKTGRISTRYYSLSAMKEDFNLCHVSDEAFLLFLKKYFLLYFKKYSEKMTEIENFKDSYGSSDPYEYHFCHQYSPSKLGHTFLVVMNQEGEECVWGMGENSDERIIILEKNNYSGYQSSGIQFKLLVDGNLNLKELTYNEFNGGDSLQKRGFIWDNESQSYIKK